MAGTTPNFAFPYPDATDPIADGAQKIEDFATLADTTLVDLKGGTTNQLLAKDTNTDMDYKWVKGINGGTTGQVLQKTSGTDNDYAWSTLTIAGMTLLGTVSMDGVAYPNVASIPSDYVNLFITIENTNPLKGSNAAGGQIGIRFNNDTTTYWSIRNTIDGSTTITNTGENTATAINSPAIYSGTTGSNERVYFQGWVYNYLSVRPTLTGTFTAGTNVFTTVNGAFDAAVTQVGAIASGTFDGGTLKVYGVK